MKEYTLKLSAMQVLALYEMIEHATSVIHRAHKGEGEGEGDFIPPSFCVLVGIQNKIDLVSESVEEPAEVMLDAALDEVAATHGNAFRRQFSVLPELDPIVNDDLKWLIARV